ncbi:MAG: DUF2800 domain-containing protein [Firmicutes bacterium]|nr:DUF2800 domain-containing protein [Bacillota bacterium]
MAEHALLSASSAHRWLMCPPSARLEQKFPDSCSQYAAEGTLAHAIAELKVRKYAVEPMGPRKYANALKKLQADPLYQPEMQEHTDRYLEEIKRICLSYPDKPYVAVEQRLDFSAFVPGGFGTGDCIIIGGDELNVVDLKYGKGVAVSAEDNPQLRLYAVGAVLRYNMLYDIRTVRTTIVQPRLDSVSSEELPVNNLMWWAEQVVKPTAEQAAAGKGAYNAGEWCRFCRAKGECKARAEHYLTLADEYQQRDPALLSLAEAGEALEKAQALKAWVSDLEEFVLAQSLAGAEVPGWKAVEGRSLRQFTDQEAAFRALTAAGVPEALLYERKPLTLAATEKAVGKAQFAEICGPYVDKPPGKPALAPATGKRPAISNKITAAEVFGAE